VPPLNVDVVVLRPLSYLRNTIGAQAMEDDTGNWPARHDSALSSGAATASGAFCSGRTSPISSASRCYTGTTVSTPAEAWLCAVQRGGVSLGSVPLGQNLSNLLRLALLYRYDGIYQDVVVLMPLSDLSNAIGA
jgi:hypothetical protein